VKSSETSSLCLSYNQSASQNFILPSMTVEIGRGNKTVTMRALIDSGSTRSYISHEKAQLLFSDIASKEDIILSVQTFFETEDKRFKEALFCIKLFGQDAFYLPLLIDDHLCIQCQIPGFNVALKNLNKSHFQFADQCLDVNKDNNIFILDMIIGADLLQFIQNVSLVSCLNGKAFNINGKIAPLGNVENFLFKNEIAVLNEQRKSFKVKSDLEIVNVALNPVHS
jgi:hypothetical protein